MKNGINVVSCFDGLAGGLIALKRRGIKVNKYYAFEIDKYAIQIAKKNHPEIIELGDINNWREFDDIEIPDLVIAGSPCQGFSIAGLGLNFDDPRSKLFFVFVDILNYWKSKNPNLKFMLENVKMKQEWKSIITEYMGVEPIEINYALVSAQNRKRLYWTNIEGVTQPEDRGLILRDILEDNFQTDREKSYCVDANYWKGGNEKSYFEKGRRQLVFGAKYNRKNGVGKKIEKSLSLCASDWRGLNRNQNQTAIIRIGTATDINDHDYNKRIYSPEGKSPTLNAHNGGNIEPKVIIDGMASDKHGHDIQKRIYNKNGKSPTLLSINSGGAIPPKLNISNKKENEMLEGFQYRKLTPLECERLQTLDDNYTEGVSNTQRYRMIGNGWTIEVISHIFSFLPKEFYPV